MTSLSDRTRALLLSVALSGACSSLALAQLEPGATGGKPESTDIEPDAEAAEEKEVAGIPEAAPEGAPDQEDEAPPPTPPEADSPEPAGALEADAAATHPEQPSRAEPREPWTKRVTLAAADGSIELQPRAWVQPRFRLALDPDQDDPHRDTGFDLKEARAGFRARLFEKGALYLESGFEKGDGRLVEYYAEVDPAEGVVLFRAGRFIPFWGRQFMMTTTELAMADDARAHCDAHLGLELERDLGVGVHGLVAEGLEYGIGIWNGENTFATDGNIDFEFGGRLAVHPLSLAGVGKKVPIGNESDVEISGSPGLVIGVAALFDKRHDLTVPIVTDEQTYYDNRLKLGVEIGFQYAGLSVLGEFFVLETWVQGDADQRIKDAVEDRDRTVAQNLVGTGIGSYLQAGYFVVPERVEVVARFDMVDEDTDLRGTRFYPAVGGTYYLHGNNLKAQLFYRLNIGTDYEEADPGYIPTTHDIILFAQAAI